LQLAEAKQEIDEHRKDEGREKNFVFEAVGLGGGV
jgi:hypothetical protein